MSNHEKIAAVVLRVIGCCAIIYALVLPLISLFFYHYTTVIEGVFSSYVYFAAGAVLFVLSKPLAKLIAKASVNSNTNQDTTKDINMMAREALLHKRGRAELVEAALDSDHIALRHS